MSASVSSGAEEEEEDGMGYCGWAADAELDGELEKVRKVADSSIQNAIYYVNYGENDAHEFNKFKKCVLAAVPEGVECPSIMHLMQYENDSVDEFIEQTFGDVKFYPAVFFGCQKGVFRLEGDLGRVVYNLSRLIFKH